MQPVKATDTNSAMCISYFWPYNKLLQSSVAQGGTHPSSWVLCVRNVAQLCCIFCFSFSLKAAQDIGPDWGLVWRLNWGRICLQTHWCAGWQFLKGCWTQGLSALLDLPGSCPQHSCWAGLSSLAACFTRTHNRESSQMEVTVLCNFITKVSSPQCCHVLLGRSKLFREKGLHKDMNAKRWGYLGLP